MKNKISQGILAILFLILVAVQPAKAQSNLQFSQVILVQLAANDSFAISVPAGKVWKIESAGKGGSATGFVFLRNASRQRLVYIENNGNAVNLPYWLPSGFSGSFISTATQLRTSISIIEYTVAP